MSPDPQIGSVWRDIDGYLVKVVAVASNGWPQVKPANGRGNSWPVNPAWFDQWEQTS